MSRGLLTTLVFCAAVLTWPAPAEGCSCAGPGLPCDAAWQADAVFVGHVVSISSTGGRRVELAVVEPFRGLQLSQVAVETGSVGNCAYPFEIGQSYLVYAHRTPEGQLTATICSRTRPLREATEDLAYARSLATMVADAPARLAGRVGLWEYPAAAGSTLKPVPRVVVTATGGSGTFSTTADDRGEFELRGLPLGKYDVVAHPRDGYAGAKRAVEIRDPRGCGTTQLYVQYDGRVIGRVVDSRGASVPALPIELVLPADVDKPGADRRAVARTAADGTFEMRLVAPNRYLLGFHSIQSLDGQRPPLPRAFYPGVVQPADASVVVVAAGERVQLKDFVVPETINLVTVTGIVVDEAGRLVQGARVVVHAVRGGSRIFAHTVETGDDGRFDFALVDRDKYEVHVTRHVATDRDNLVRVGIVPFTAAAGTAVTVVLNPNQHR